MLYQRHLPKLPNIVNLIDRLDLLFSKKINSFFYCCFILNFFNPGLLAESTHSTLERLAEQIEFESWGEFSLRYEDYPPEVYQDLVNPQQKDSHALANIEQLSLDLKHQLGEDWGYRIEFRFEHAGVTAEEDPNYLGPFAEPNRGRGRTGGITLNQFFIYKNLTSHIEMQGGRIPIAFGLASDLSPSDLIAPNPFESEANLVPVSWSEVGLAIILQKAVLKSTSQIVSGLDSTGFNSRSFVGLGQQAFSNLNVSSPALVQRVDFNFEKIDLLSGVSFYYSETSQNRPTPDMAKSCSKNKDKNVAPCGYKAAPLSLFDFHIVYDNSNFVATYQYIFGKIKNSEEINIFNISNTSNLPSYFSPVASQAFGSMLEVAYRLDLNDGQFLKPFFRWEHYNTMQRTATNEGSGPRFDRQILESGMGFFSENFYTKLSYLRRTLGFSSLPTQQTVTLVFGFMF